MAERRIDGTALALVPVILSSFLAFLTFCLLALRAGQSELTAFNLAGAILATGWIATIVGIPAFHELFHRLWRALAGLGLFGGAMFAIGGWRGLAACFGSALIARFLLESFNYFQHYGQVRVPGTPDRAQACVEPFRPVEPGDDVRDHQPCGPSPRPLCSLS